MLILRDGTKILSCAATLSVWWNLLQEHTHDNYQHHKPTFSTFHQSHGVEGVWIRNFTNLRAYVTRAQGYSSTLHNPSSPFGEIQQNCCAKLCNVPVDGRGNRSIPYIPYPVGYECYLSTVKAVSLSYEIKCNTAAAPASTTIALELVASVC